MRVRLLLCYAWIVNILQRSASLGCYLTINSIGAIQRFKAEHSLVYKYMTS